MAFGKDERMNMKFAGALLVIAGCGGFGFSMAAAYRYEERLLKQLRDILQFMYCELQYHLTPLPELCHRAGTSTGGAVGKVFSDLSALLNMHNNDVSECIQTAIRKAELTPRIREIIGNLGRTLGTFDLDGQLLGLEEQRARCCAELESLAAGREDRLRSYQTLGLCAGAALVILFV